MQRRNKTSTINKNNKVKGDSMKYILASKSPRRKELLKTIIEDFDVKESNFDESSIKCKSPRKLVAELAKGKCKTVFESESGVRCVIGADSIVVIDNQILGKPKNEEDAKRMLKLLRGRKHKVLTGICVMATTDEESEVMVTFVCSTTVLFRYIENEEIDKYVATKEPLDKAGSYAIQGIAGKYVQKISGSFHNIVGLPIAHLDIVLQNEGLI